MFLYPIHDESTITVTQESEIYYQQDTSNVVIYCPSSYSLDAYEEIQQCNTNCICIQALVPHHL